MLIGVIIWLSQKQATVTLSTAVGSAAQEPIWIKQLQVDLNISAESSTEILEDNQKWNCYDEQFSRT